MRIRFLQCENKDGDHLLRNHTICFRYIDSTTPLLPLSEISSLYQSSLAVCLCLYSPKDKFSHDATHLVKLIKGVRFLT